MSIIVVMTTMTHADPHDGVALSSSSIRKKAEIG